MKRKILNKKGFTLAEVLIATAILSLFVSMAIMGTSALFGSGEKMMTVSKAAVLGSDVMKAVTNEVRFGEEFSIDADTNTIKYNSTTYGNNCEMTLEDGQLVIVQTSSSYTEGAESAPGKPFYPISSAAYDEVKIKSIVFELSAKTDSKGNVIRHTVTCKLEITSDGTNTLWSKDVSIVPLYQKTDY